MDELETLRARQAEIAEQLRALNDEIGDAEPTEEQTNRWEQLEAEHRDLTDTRIPAAQEAVQRRDRVRESRARWQSTQVSPNVDPKTSTDVRAMPAREVRDRALKTLDDNDSAGHLGDRQREQVEQLLRTRNRNTDGDALGRLLLATNTEEYRSAFQKIAGSQIPILSPEEARAVTHVNELRAASIGTDGAGGFAVPVKELQAA